jgi:fatty acid desaturase
MSRQDTEDMDGRELRQIRLEVRRKLNFYRNAFTFVVVVAILALVNWLTSDYWWVAWVAGIWGGFLALDFLRDFVGPSIWGRNVEERMVERELERRRNASEDPPAR